MRHPLSDLGEPMESREEFIEAKRRGDVPHSLTYEEFLHDGLTIEERTEIFRRLNDPNRKRYRFK